MTRRNILASVSALAAGVLASLALVGPDAGARLKAGGTDLLAAMHLRSPGERTAGAVTTKHKRQPVARHKRHPVMHVLAAAEPAPVAAAVPAGVPAVAAPAALAPLVASPVLAAAPAALAPAVLAPAVAPVIAASGIPVAVALIPLVPIVAAIGDGGGGGGAGGGGGGTVTPPPPPGPAVPEPSAWIMLITGFAILGAALRRRRRTPSAALAVNLAPTR